MQKVDRACPPDPGVLHATRPNGDGADDGRAGVSADSGDEPAGHAGVGTEVTSSRSGTVMMPTVLLLRRLRPLLDRTLDLNPAERDAYLERLAREAPDDAREVAALLAAEPVLDAARFLCR